MKNFQSPRRTHYRVSRQIGLISEKQQTKFQINLKLILKKIFRKLKRVNK